MGFRKSVKQSSFMLVFVAASFATLFVTGLTHAQWGIELEVEGNSTVEGNLDVLGFITAGIGESVLTNASGLIDGSKIQTGTVASGQLGANAVTTGKLNDGAVTGAKIAATTIAEGNLQNGAVTSGKLAADAVTNAKIADNAVGTTEIIDSAVTSAKIANGTITNNDIAANNSITADRLATNSVGSDEIATGAVGSDEIADGAVSTADLANGAVDATKLAANAVTETRILDNAVTSAKILDGTILAGDLHDDAVTSAKILDSTIVEGNLATGAVTSAKILDGTITNTDIAATNSITADRLAPNSVGTSEIVDNAVNADKLDETASYTVNNLYADGASGKIGIGTTTVPRGGYGDAKLALHGPNQSLLGPHFRTTTFMDDFPVMDFTSWKHDNMGIRFDAYFDGAQRSASPDSNAMLVKGQNKISFWYANGVAAGSVIPTWNVGFSLDLTNGNVSMEHLPTGTGSYPVRIGADGKLYKDPSSSIRYKENVREAATADTSWIYGLRAVMFDYKDHTLGTNQCGLIAEEVEQVNANIVVYREDITYGPEITDENGNPDQTGYRPMIVTKTNEPETVRYDKLTVPILAEMQKLRDRVQELEAQVAQLKTLEARLAALEAKQQP